LNTKSRNLKFRNCAYVVAGMVFYCAAFVGLALGQAAAGSVKLTLEQAIDLATQRNHNLLATRTTIQQNLAQEVTANLRPNPTFFTDWEYLPLYKPNVGILDYLHDSTEGDVGMSYLFERGEKRQHRLEAAQDATAVTRENVLVMGCAPALGVLADQLNTERGPGRFIWLPRTSKVGFEALVAGKTHARRVKD